jgi:hypothetical protein
MMETSGPNMIGLQKSADRFSNSPPRGGLFPLSNTSSHTSEFSVIKENLGDKSGSLNNSGSKGDLKQIGTIGSLAFGMGQGDKASEDVLATVTNSFNTGMNGSLFASNQPALKKLNSGPMNNASAQPFGGFGGMSMGSNNSTQTSAKKENDKKKWLKRI